MTNEDEDTSNLPILTLDGESKPESDNLEDRPTLPDKEAERKTEAATDTDSKESAHSSSTGDEDSVVTEAKASVNSKTEPEASSKTGHDFNAIYDELHTKFPNIINMDKPVLLAIAIRGKMLEEVSVPGATLNKWIAWYFRKSSYYSMHKVGVVRYNLDGTGAGTVTEKDQAKRDKQRRQTKERQSQKKDRDSKETGSKKQNEIPAENKSEDSAPATDAHDAK